MPAPTLSKPRLVTGILERRFAALLLFFSIGLLLAGCRPKADATDDAVHVAVEFDPAPPATGECGLSLSLADATGQPLRIAHLAVEGDMNHAGMRPVFAHLSETAPGRYRGKIEFTMGGDWFLLVSGELAGGRRFEKRLDVPGVKTR